MKILLDIQENKVAFFMEMLKSLKFVKQATPLSDSKAEILKSVRQGVIEMNEVIEGKKEARDVEELLNEL